MIEYIKGNIFESEAVALVNTVNCVGVMGKGMAKECKARYPGNFEQYYSLCNAGLIKIGEMFTEMDGGKIIINFPTKKHWREPSQYEYILHGLVDLKSVIKGYKISSVAIPPLGCGNGGLEWSKVKPMIEEHLKDLDCRIIIYEPQE